MARTKHEPKHELLLGKKKAARDPRTILLKNVMVAAPPSVPPEFHVDKQIPGSPVDALANTRYGCCVISAQGHAIRRFELWETNKLIRLTDQEVINEYMRQTGGADNGLVMLQSLKKWKLGWVAGGKRSNIYGYAAINRKNQDEYKQAIFARLGCQIGVSLPTSAKREIDAGNPWATTSGAGSTPGSWGDHAIYVEGYDATGLTCITWGQKQHATWPWIMRYCDEAYAIVDAINLSKTKKLISEEKFEDELERVSEP